MSTADRLTHKAFLPGSANVLLPLRPRTDALAALSLYSPSRRRALAVRDAAWWWIRGFGARLLPGRSTAWQPPMDARSWMALMGRLADMLGPHTSLGLYQPRDAYRHSFGLLWVVEGTARAFVKADPSAQDSTREWLTLRALAEHTPRAFWAPAPIAHLVHGDWGVLAMSAVTDPLHRPAYVDPSALVADVVRCLSTIPRSSDAPPRWTPMHGDLTPWNLRAIDGSPQPALLDWATATWGPPGADEVLYRATVAAMGHRDQPRWRPEHSEARTYWTDVIPSRTTSLDALNRGVLALLAGDT